MVIGAGIGCVMTGDGMNTGDADGTDRGTNSAATLNVCVRSPRFSFVNPSALARMECVPGLASGRYGNTCFPVLLFSAQMAVLSVRTNWLSNQKDTLATFVVLFTLAKIDKFWPTSGNAITLGRGISLLVMVLMRVNGANGPILTESMTEIDNDPAWSNSLVVGL